MRKIFIAVIAAALLFGGCDIVKQIDYALSEELESYGTVQVTSAPAEVTDAVADDSAPALPDMDFGGLDFFSDGYEMAEFARITDGDTASFIMGGLNVKCRFVGVNTPELDHDGGSHEPFAEDARDFCESVLQSADVIILERDEKAGEYDRYDRLLAHVWADGVHLGYALVSLGLADMGYYWDDYKYYDEVEEALERATDEGLGIWE